MADDIQRDRETVEKFPISVTEHYLFPVPECIILLLVEMDSGVHRHPLVVDRITIILCPEKIVGGAEAVVGLIDDEIAAGWPTLDTEDIAAQRLDVVSVGDGALYLAFHGSHR